MPRPINQLPAWAQHKVNDAKLANFPRFKDKEITIHLYETNQSVRTINETTKDTSLIVQSQLKQKIQFRYSNQSLEFSSRQFENPADSAYWSIQLKGYVYEQLEINPKMYSYITIEEDTEDTIQYSTKFRLTRNAPVSGATNQYAFEILGVQETIKSFPALDNSQFQLVDNLKIQDKIRKIEIEIENNAQFFPNGLQIYTKENFNDGNLNRNNILKINNQELINDLSLTKIEINNINPLITNYQSWQYIWDKTEFEKDGLKWPLFSIKFSNNEIANNINWQLHNNNLYVSTNVAHATIFAWNEYIKNIDFFTSDFIYKKYNLAMDLSWKKDIIFLKDFLNGIAKDSKTNYVYSQLPKQWEIKTNISKLEDLKVDALRDRQWFVLLKNLDFKNQFKSIQSSKFVQFGFAGFGLQKPKLNFSSLYSDEWKEIINEKNIKINFDLERNEYSPRIEIRQKEASWVKIKLFNENEELVSEATFPTSNKFNDGEFVSIFKF